MPLFEIPGWSLSSDPIIEPRDHGSKKRKRSSGDTDRPESMEVNLEKLVKRLKRSSEPKEDRNHNRKQAENAGSSVGRKGQTKRRERKSKTDDIEERKKTISLPKPLKATIMDSDIVIVPSQTKTLKESRPIPEVPLPKKAENADVPGPSGLTSLQKEMKQSLDGARFRLINETLYKTDSVQAHQMVLNDRKVYEDYHVGFRHQVELWPTNPVQCYSSALSSYPPGTVIADLGCGDAAIARALIPQGKTVLSFDLVSDGAFVVEADICTRIPLPGSEGIEGEVSDGEGSVVDVAVCALSLMGTNWPNCLREAWRILKIGGELKIAEVASRFRDAEEFLALVQSIGFTLDSKDDTNSHFTLFDFRKASRKWKTEREWSKIMRKSNVLKPCEYKRR